jgi:putative peptidoglycan lipid II flippase
VKVLAPAFYALGSPRVPLLGSLLAVGANILILTICYGFLGYRGVALGTAAGSLLNALLLALAFERRQGGLLRRDVGVALAKMSLAALGMTLLVLAARQALVGAFPQDRLSAQLMTALVPIVLGAVVYLLAARALGLEEVGAAASAFRRGRSGSSNGTLTGPTP